MQEATRAQTEKRIHQAFIVSVIAKGIIAGLETILGILLLFTNSVVDLVSRLASGELIEDPSDMVANWVQPYLHPTQEATIFGGLYLLSHGIIKIFLVAGLLRNKLWAYPASIAVFILFIVYQIFRYFAKTHSPWLLVITVIDVIVIWLIYHEYRQILKRQIAP